MKRGKILILFFLLLLPIAFAFCGDGIVDYSENCGNCPEDNPCFVDDECIENQCIPRIIPPLFIKADPTATIIIPTEIANSLNNKFSQETEFVSCLKGKYADGIYQIREETEPEVLEGSPFHIEHKGCPYIGTIATIHSHLDGNCNPSRADLFSFGRKREPIMAIICGENNFGFYSKADFESRMDYLIRQVPPQENHYIFFFFPWILSIALIIFSVLILYERHRAITKKNREIALNILEEFNKTERKLLNILIEMEQLPRKNIPPSILTKLNQENLIEVRSSIVKLKKWFRDALKGL